MSESTAIVPYEIIERRIVLLRGKKVMLSPDLAQLYGVEPRALLQAVRRNLDRFPEDFMSNSRGRSRKLSFFTGGVPGSVPPSRSQSVTLKRGQNIKVLPFALMQKNRGVSKRSYAP